MTNRTSPKVSGARNPYPPTATPTATPEHRFAAAVIDKMTNEGRKWAWLAQQAELNPNTLRSQLVDEPSRLKMITARRIATALDIPFWDAA